MGKPELLALSQKSGAIRMRKSRLRKKYGLSFYSIACASSKVQPVSPSLTASVSSDCPVLDPLGPVISENNDVVPHNNGYNDEMLHNDGGDDISFEFLEDDVKLLAQELREAFILCGTPVSHVSMILKILNKRHRNLPRDYRTLFETPKFLNVRKMEEGKYVHFGLEKELTSFLKREHSRPSVLTLDFHIDGVNITESSKVSLWTILCK